MELPGKSPLKDLLRDPSSADPGHETLWSGCTQMQVGHIIRGRSIVVCVVKPPKPLYVGRSLQLGLLFHIPSST